MFFCDTPNEVAHWWARLLGVPFEMVNEESEFRWFSAGGTEFGFHPADDGRNPRGGSPVVYLATSNLETSIDEATAMGANIHRGPLILSPERVIAQLVDPFGNVFGIDGA